jgi:hypothetical protein
MIFLDLLILVDFILGGLYYTLEDHNTAYFYYGITIIGAIPRVWLLEIENKRRKSNSSYS